MIVEEIGINDLDKWSVDSDSGNIKHESGGFFEVIGVKASNTFDREVGKKGWTQPMIGKNPGGILGIIMKRINTGQGRGLAVPDGMSVSEVYSERKPLYEKFAEYTLDGSESIEGLIKLTKNIIYE